MKTWLHPYSAFIKLSTKWLFFTILCGLCDNVFNEVYYQYMS